MSHCKSVKPYSSRLSLGIFGLSWWILCAATAVATAAVVPDMLGRPMEIPDRPLRLVSLAPSITETVYALGRETG